MYAPGSIPEGIMTIAPRAFNSTIMTGIRGSLFRLPTREAGVIADWRITILPSLSDGDNKPPPQTNAQERSKIS